MVRSYEGEYDDGLEACHGMRRFVEVLDKQRAGGDVVKRRGRCSIVTSRLIGSV